MYKCSRILLFNLNKNNFKSNFKILMAVTKYITIYILLLTFSKNYLHITSFIRVGVEQKVYITDIPRQKEKTFLTTFIELCRAKSGRYWFISDSLEINWLRNTDIPWQKKATLHPLQNINLRRFFFFWRDKKKKMFSCR